MEAKLIVVKQLSANRMAANQNDPTNICFFYHRIRIQLIWPGHHHRRTDNCEPCGKRVLERRSLLGKRSVGRPQHDGRQELSNQVECN